jgi:hypothetical protein
MKSLPDMWWGFLGPEPVSGVSRRDIQNRHSRWLNSQHCASWRDPSNTLRQARELISGPCLGNRAKFLSFNRTHSRVVTRHNTLRRHPFLRGLVNSPICRGCGVMEETSAHVLCECEAWASLRHIHLGSFFLKSEDIKSVGLGAICCFGKAAGLPWLWFGAQRVAYKA